MKKDKIFDLRIDEFDEFSGIDSISLVSEPAIAIEWLAFNKSKKLQDFHIPDGEDEIYLNRIKDKGHDEQELIDEGWEIHSVEPISQENFGLTTTPNESSEEDTEEFRIRYKYGLNPKLTGQSSIIPTTREWCRVLLNRNKVYRLEDILSLPPDLDESYGDPKVYRGGFNCRHWWFKILYKPTGKIRNNATITINREQDDAGRSSNLPTEWTQGQTITEKTRRAVDEGRANPKTKKHLPFESETINVFGYKPRYFHMCPGAIETFKHLISMEIDEETIGMIRSAAQVADNVFRIEEEVIKSEQATPDQLLQATVLVEDFKDIIHEIDEETGMIHDVSYMDGHIEKIKTYVKEDLDYVNNLPSYVDEITTGITEQKFETYNDYPESAKNNACKVLRWRDEHGDEVKGMTRIGWTRANQLCNGSNISESTIARMSAFQRHKKNAEVAPEFKSTPWKDKGYVAWLGWGGTTGIEWASRKLESIRKKKMSKAQFATDEEKRTLVGVAMVPDKLILRYDNERNPYYVRFSAEEISKIMRKYMRNKYTDNNDLDHDGKAVRDVYVIESWIVEDEKHDKSRKYGFDVPVGSWLVSMKIAETPKGDLIWERVKKGELNGFSVSGYFEEVAAFAKEEMFLKKVVDILKSVKD